MEKKKKGEQLLLMKQQSRQQNPNKNFHKIVGKQKSNAKFNKVNFNG